MVLLWLTVFSIHAARVIGEPSLKQLLDWEPHLATTLAFNITTNSSTSQKLFKVGLLLLYNFDQPNARAAFQHCLAFDADCAMCSWGLAHSYGPFLNHPQRSAEDLQLGLSAAARSAKAVTRRSHARKEQVLIEAMILRYPPSAEPSKQSESYQHYARRLRELRAEDVELLADPDLKVFDAEAVMVLMCDSAGYHFYTSRGDSLAPVEMNATREATALLREALAATGQKHPYAHHLLIHSTEMSNAEAEGAVDAANQLLGYISPFQDQHLQHMTSHTFFRTGHYHESALANLVAMDSDADYLHHGLVGYGPGHNAVFCVCSAMWGGERAVAYKSVKRMQQIYMESPGRGDGPNGKQAWSYPMLVALRFGDWSRVKQLDVVPPGNFSEEWPYGYGVLHEFSLAIADLHLGLGGEEEIQNLRGFMPVVAATKDALLMNLTEIANHTVSAVWASAHGDLGAASVALKMAVDIEMGMPYDEPPVWLLPSRECYGQALLNARRPEDAEKVFRALLYGYSFHAEPRSGWALIGLMQSLQQQEQTASRQAELEKLKKNLEKAWKYADVPLTSACLHVDFRNATVDGTAPVLV